MSRKLFSLREKVVQHLTSPVSFAVRAAVNLGHVRLFFESLQRCGNTRWRNESRAPDAPKCRCSARRWQRSDVFRSASIQCRRARARALHTYTSTCCLWPRQSRRFDCAPVSVRARYTFKSPSSLRAWRFFRSSRVSGSPRIIIARACARGVYLFFWEECGLSDFWRFTGLNLRSRRIWKIFMILKLGAWDYFYLVYFLFTC